MSFFEKYIAKELDFAEEIKNIEILLSERNGYSESIYFQIAESFLFCNKKLRRTAISLKDYQKKSGILDILNKVKNKELITIEDLIDYIEYIKTLIGEFLNILIADENNHQNLKAITENIDTILDSINFDIVWCELDEDTKYAKCIEKDYKVRESAEIVNDEKLAEKIYLYNHHSLKGNIFEKAIILSRLYMYFEGIRSNLNQNNLKSLFDNVSDLSDKMNVRHKPNNREEIIIAGFTDQQIEEIYDKMYKDYLSAIIIDDALKNKAYLRSIRDKFNAKANTDNQTFKIKGRV